MSITLELPPEIENALVADAIERGVPVEELATHAMQVFLSYSAPFERLVQRMGRTNRSTIEAPTGTGKTDAIIEWLAAMHGMDKEQTQFQMSVLYAAVALREASNDLQTLPIYLEQLNAAFDERETQLADPEEAPAHVSPNRGFGFLKGRISGSDAFLAEKHAEAQREREKDEARGHSMRTQHQEDTLVIAVLDSSAMIAYIAGESEGIAVDALFTSARDEGEDIAIYAHAVNLCETFYSILAQEGVTVAEECILRIKEDGLIERNDMDGPFWRDVAHLVVAGRGLPRPLGGRGNLAFGDAVGIALTNRLGGEFVTKDRTEIEPIEAAGLVKACFIR